jgi:hypothetical protein
MDTSNPSLILTRLRTGRATTSELAALIDGDRDDVSRAVAHLRDRGFLVPSYRPMDEFGTRGEAAYVLAYDPASPQVRRCVAIGCGKVLNKYNPGMTVTGRGPYCHNHRDQVESLELDGFIFDIAHEAADPDLQMSMLEEVMAG